VQQDRETESLDELSVTEVFERCLAAHQVEEGQRSLLRAAFAEITTALDQGENRE